MAELNAMSKRHGSIGNYITGKSLKAGVTKGSQPSYTRAPNTRAISPKLLKFRACVRDKLAGKDYTGPNQRQQARDAFASAAKACKV